MIELQLLWRRIGVLEAQIRPLEDQLQSFDRKRRNGTLRGPGSKRGRPTRKREAVRKRLMVLVHDQLSTFERIARLS